MLSATKLCNGPCGLEKPAADFHRRGNGLKSACKLCRAGDPIAKAWRRGSTRRAANKRWRKTPKGKLKERRDNAKRSLRPKTVQERVRGNLRCRLNQALRAGAKAGSAVSDLGCSVDNLKTHLERLWQLGMAWENWGRGPGTWQIDHIKPLASFDLTDREQFLQACHYTNLQPLWHKEHVIKSAEEQSRGA